MWANVDTDMANTPHSASTQKVAVLIGDGYDNAEVSNVLNPLNINNVFIDIIGEKLGYVAASDGNQLKVEETIKTKLPVLYDAVYIVGGSAVNQGEFDKKVMQYYDEAFKHYKPIGISSSGEALVNPLQNNGFPGIICASTSDKFSDDFVAAIAQKRFWDRAIY